MANFLNAAVIDYVLYLLRIKLESFLSIVYLERKYIYIIKSQLHTT